MNILSMWAEKLEEARPRLLELDSMTYTKPVRIIHQAGKGGVHIVHCTNIKVEKYVIFFLGGRGVDSMTKLVTITSVKTLCIVKS